MESASVITIEKPAPPSIVAELAPVVQAAKVFTIDSIEAHGAALDRIKRLRLGERAIEDHFARAKKAASDAHRQLVASIAALTGPLAEARGIYDRAAAAFEQEQKRIAEEESRRLQELARQQEEERALMDAVEAESAGDAAGAEAILAQPVAVPVVHVAPQVATVAGVSSRMTWSAEVTDLVALVKYVAAHPEWISLLEPSMPNLNRLAVAQRQALSIPGVKAVSKTVRATR